MHRYCWLDDQLVERDVARISPFEPGLQYGDGLFETLRTYGGIPHLLHRHLARLGSSADRIELPVISGTVIGEGMDELIHANRLRNARVRISLWRSQQNESRLLIESGDLPILSDDPINVPLLQAARIPRAGGTVKSLNYQFEISILRSLASRGEVDGLLLTSEGDVAEGCMSNLFVVNDGVLKTPAVDRGILPGITRQRVLELAAQLKISTLETRVEPHELLASDEVFLTNSVREILPVMSIDGVPLHQKAPGRLTQKISAVYRKEAPQKDL